MAEHHETIRLDIWLWAARFFKTRGLAKAAIGAGRIKMLGRAVKPARDVKVGDVLEVERGEIRQSIEVLGLSRLRGSAPAAALLYAETPESIAARDQERARRAAAAPGFVAAAVKPDKADRRALQALKSQSD